MLQYTKEKASKFINFFNISHVNCTCSLNTK